MNANAVICKTNNVTYGELREAMANGASTIEELKEMTGACGNEDCCKAGLDSTFNLICVCKKVRRDKILAVIKKGAKTVDKVSQYTEAGTGCGKCKKIIERLIQDNA